MMAGSGATAVGGITAVAAMTTAVADPLVPVLGVPLAYLLAACAGALIGLGHAKPGTWLPFMSLPEGSHAKRMAWVVLRAAGLAVTVGAIAVLAAWCVVVAPHVPFIGWTKDIPPLPFAGILAAGGQYLFPRILTAAGRYVERRAEGAK